MVKISPRRACKKNIYLPPGNFWFSVPQNKKKGFWSPTPKINEKNSTTFLLSVPYSLYILFILFFCMSRKKQVPETITLVYMPPNVKQISSNKCRSIFSIGHEERRRQGDCSMGVGSEISEL